MNFRYLRSLGTSQLFTGIEPWEFRCPGLDPGLRSDKKRRDAWITNRATSHHVYGVAIGRNPEQRISSPTRTGEGNPPVHVLGIAADFDSAVTPDEVASRLTRESDTMPAVPMWYERTMSGNARLLWVFAAPAVVPSFAFATLFMEVAAERLRLEYLLPGLDLKATVNVSRYFTNSGEWYPIEGATPVPEDLIAGWLVEAGRQHAFSRDPETAGDELTDLTPVVAALRERYPRFTEWPGEFVIGSMGPTFWIPESQSPKSATVRPGGMQTFSGHAAKGFYAWSDLLDQSVVKGMQDTNMGAAVRGIYYDDQLYWIPAEVGTAWQPVPKTMLDIYLQESRGLTRKAPPGGVSQIDRAQLYIARYNRVSGVGSAVFFPSGPRRGADGKVLLNQSTRTVLPPTEDRGMEWGETGHFPFISGFLEHLLPDEKSRNAFLGWLGHAYAHAYERSPVPGQAVFLIGPPDLGKSLCGLFLVGALFGGSADAGEYLHGRDSFGGELYDYGVLRSDDNRLIVSAATREVLTERLKSLVANSEVRVHCKYRAPTYVTWMGRVIGGGNDDPLSLTGLPMMSASLEDKISLFRTGTVKYPGLLISREHTQHRFAAELPCLARWLLEHPPRQLGCELDSRFGVRRYHDASLIAESRAQSTVATTMELIDMWRREQDPSAKPWVGSALQLRLLVGADLGRKSILDRITPDRFRRDLLLGSTENSGWLHVCGSNFVVDPAADESSQPPASTDTPQKANSKFSA